MVANDAPASDESLVEQARRGSDRAFGQLIDRHQQVVRGFLRKLVSDRSEAEDIAQEAFLAAWTSLGAFRGQSSFRSWLCGIAWKKAKSAQRSAFRRMGRDGAYEELSAMERGSDIGAVDKIALQRALAGLPLEQRAAVALCLSGELSHGDAAEALGLPLGTVKSHVNRGRAKLLESLGGQS